MSSQILLFAAQPDAKQEKRERYAAKKEAKRERLAERAEKLKEASDAALGDARRTASHIPMGQPILVGHHSEKRHRRDIARIDSKMSKGFELAKKAEQLASRAAHESTAIMSEDPDATDKISAQIATLEAERESYKAANKLLAKAYRAAKKANAGEDVAGFEALAAVASSAGLDAPLLALVLRGLRNYGAPSSIHCIKFGYQITNSGAEIRRLRQRIASLAAEQAARDAAPEEEPEQARAGFVIRECPDDERIRLIFDGKPSAAIRDELKMAGFRWSREAVAWQRLLNANGRMAAQRVAARIEAL